MCKTVDPGLGFHREKNPSLPLASEDPHGRVLYFSSFEQILATSGAEQSATEQLASATRAALSARHPQDRDPLLASFPGPGRDGPGLTR